MDNFDKQVKEEIQGYLDKHVHFSREESQQIRSKTVNKSSTKSFHGVYYTVLAAAIILISILSVPLFKTINFNSNTPADYIVVEEKETNDNKEIKASLDQRVNGNAFKRSRQMLPNEITDKLQLAVINAPEKYRLTEASYNYWSNSGESIDITLALSFNSQQNSYFTQIFKGQVKLEDNHKVIEKSGNWKLIPESETSSGDNKYIIAVSEIVVNQEKYTIIVQTYDIHDDFYANPYSKTDIVNFLESLQLKVAVKNLLEINTEDSM
ncbi:hypothetical protein H9635_09320 [Solibacillus sp. A46]|uniref:Uncharacterized protein n=1 Tax=Solibacillus faecavium TaxID=2762221 RepID=A0ABR8XYD8_9BACL|nr:hypothetical protein [Solibacillus faecavium]MBD8036943.1 hypothetical protein [Solibacillus faecavium]